MEDKKGFHAGCAMARFHTSRAAAIAYDVLSYSPIFLHAMRLRISHSKLQEKQLTEITDAREESNIGSIRQEKGEVANVEHHPVNAKVSHFLFISQLPWNREIEPEELQKTLEDAGIHGISLVKIGEYMNELLEHRYIRLLKFHD